MIIWSILSTAAAIVVHRKINGAKKASTVVRKIFHLLAVAVYVPGLIYHCNFLYLASGVVLGVFIILDVSIIHSRFEFYYTELIFKCRIFCALVYCLYNSGVNSMNTIKKVEELINFYKLWEIKYKKSVNCCKDKIFKEKCDILSD